MEESQQYRLLKVIAIALGLGTLAVLLYTSVIVRAQDPYLAQYDRASRDFKDRLYEDALEHYQLALEIDPEAEGALRGKADSLSLLGNHLEALEIYDNLILRDDTNGIYYANRGIIHDRMGRYQDAIADYDRAYSIDAELDDGPGWWTRFMRNQQDKPPTIALRSAYLKQQLSLPADQRVLRIEEEDAKQRPYNY